MRGYPPRGLPSGRIPSYSAKSGAISVILKWPLRLRALRRRSSTPAGFTLFELIIVICIVSFLAGIMLNRLHLYQEAAEKVAMQQTAAAIKSGLQMRVAALMIDGRESEIERLRNENPVGWLQEKPGNYAGEFYADAYVRVQPGSWYFDLARRELVYVLNRGDNFKSGPDGRKWVRYRVRLEYDLVSAKDAPPRKVLSAVTFAPAQAYAWL
jgi:general secretion pathway protein G